MEKENPKKEKAKTVDEIINEVSDKYTAEADAKLFGGKKMPKPEPETAPGAPSGVDADDKKAEPAPKPEPEKTEGEAPLSEPFGRINKQNEELKEKLLAKNTKENLSDAFSKINKQNEELKEELTSKDTKENLSDAFKKINAHNKELEKELETKKEGDKRSPEAKKIDELMGKAFDLGGESAKKEKISISEKERDERLLELGKELEAARREYIIKDYNLDKNSGIFKKLFGFGKRSQLGEFNREYETARSRYEEVLKKFKDATVEGLVLDRQEAEMTSNWLEKGEFIELQKTRDQIRMENAPWSQGIKNGCMKLIDKYRKLPTWKKIAIGFGVAGIASVGGVAGIGAAATLGVGWRIFTSGVSAIGFKGMYEGVAEGYRNKKTKSNTEKNLNASRNQKAEFDPEIFKKRLDDKIKTVDREIQKRKAWGKFRLWLAIGSAAAVFFGGRYIAEKVMGNLSGSGSGGKSNDDLIKEYFRSKNIEREGITPAIVSQERIGMGTESVGSDMTNDDAVREQMETHSGGDSLNEKAQEISIGETSDDISSSDHNPVESGTDIATADTIPIPLEKIQDTAFELRSGITDADKDLWDSIKNMTYEEIHNQNDSRLVGVNHKLDELRVQYAEKFGHNAEPISGQTLAQYTEHLARLNNGNPLKSAVEIHDSSPSGDSLTKEDSFPAGSSAEANFEKFRSSAYHNLEKFKSEALDKLNRTKRRF